MQGHYGSTHTKFVLSRSGTRKGQITIRSAPGARVTVEGWIILDGSHVTLSHLNIDGSNTFYRLVRPGIPCRVPVSQGLSITGHNDVFEYNNLYQSVPKLRSVGIGIGWAGDPYRTVIRFNRIHDVGQCQAFDPLIYLANGNHVRIYGNWMANDRHGRGVQLYPGPQNSRIWDNVIDRAGSGFGLSDGEGEVASGNRIFNNLIVRSTGLPWESLPGYAITSFWATVPGTGNAFYNNISYGNRGGIARVTHVKLWGNRGVSGLRAVATTDRSSVVAAAERRYAAVIARLTPSAISPATLLQR